MTAAQENAIAKLREQQAKLEDSAPAKGVAEQLIDICSRDSAAAEIILPDLDNPDMSVSNAEKEVRKLADEKHKKSRSSAVCVTYQEAECVLRRFYGLPDGPAPRYEIVVDAPDHISLADFL